MTLGKHLSIMTPTRPFVVTVYGITLTYDSIDKVPEQMLDADLERITKDKVNGQLIYILREENEDNENN